jgi:hypothetical protein
MRRARTFAMLAVLFSSWNALAWAASTTPAVKKQQISIVLVQRQDPNGQFFGSVQLIPAEGRLKPGKGTFTSVEGVVSRGTKDGQAYELGRGVDSVKTKAGTFEIHRTDRILSAGSGYTAITGTWSIARGTGDFSGVAGGGRHAGVVLSGTSTAYVEFDGYLALP